jgi:hypothetical protein
VQVGNGALVVVARERDAGPLEERLEAPRVDGQRSMSSAYPGARCWTADSSPSR